MPLHDWTRVPSGVFHDFHQAWSIAIRNALNAGRLPSHLIAMVEQKSGPLEGDVLAIESDDEFSNSSGGGTLVLEQPTARIVRKTDRSYYSEKANRIVVRHSLGRIVAVIEIVSPGNKDGVRPFHQFVEKIAGFIEAGIHALIIDVFPPTARDPLGVHKAIWDQFVDEEFAFPSGTDRILVSYEAGSTKSAFVEPIGVGDSLGEMPLFVGEGVHVKVPLESAYQGCWDVVPEVIRRAVLSGSLKNAAN